MIYTTMPMYDVNNILTEHTEKKVTITQFFFFLRNSE